MSLLRVNEITKLDGSAISGGGGSGSWQTFGIGSSITNYTLGKVGIGITFPRGNLHVVDTIVVSSGSTSVNSSLTNAIQTKAYLNQYSIEDLDGYGTRQYISIAKSDTDLFKVNDDFFATKFVVGAGGSVGIGSTQPKFALDVIGNTNISGNLTVNNVDVSGGLSWKTVGTGNTIYSLSRVGIGTTRPVQSLHVVDAIVVSSGSTIGVNTLSNAIQTKAYLNQYSIEDVDGFGARQYISIAKSDTDLFKVNDDFSVTKFVVGAGGSVGIATTNPRFTLDVIGTTNISGNTNIGGNLTVNNVDVAGGLSWKTVGSGNTIYTLGRVGIGTTNPRGNLHVVDSIVVSSGSTTGFNTLSNAIQTKAYLNQYSIEDVDGFGARQYISIAKSDTDLFKVNDDFSVTKFVVGAGGSVGIATTNPRFTLDVIGTTNISGNTNIGGNLTVNNVDVAGGLSWKTVGSGNTIYTLGRVGIGTTRPVQRLHVVDAIVVSSGSTTGINTLSNAIQTKAYANQYSIEDVDGFGTRQYISIAKSDTDLFKVNDDLFSTKFVVGAGGSVGIGSTQPKFALDVVGSSNISGSLFVNNVNIAGGLTWQTGIGNTIYNLGRVGIGTTNPRGNLHVVDSIVVSSGSTTGVNTLSNAIQTKAYPTQYSIEDIDGFGTRQYFSINKSDTDLFKVNDDFSVTKFVVGAGGSVGIGTTNPTSALHVSGTTELTGVLESVSVGNTFAIAGTNRIILECDALKSTVFTYNLAIGPVGIVSFKNIPVSKNSATTFTVLFTQNATGTANTTITTGIGTNVFLSPQGVTGFTTTSKVATASTITLSTTALDVDIVSFIVHYNGSGTGITSNYTVYATNTTGFRYGSVGF